MWQRRESEAKGQSSSLPSELTLQSWSVLCAGHRCSFVVACCCLPTREKVRAEQWSRWPQRLCLPGVLGLRSKQFEFMFVNRHSSSSVLNEANVLCLFSESLSAQHELVLSDETEGASGDSAGS